MTKAKSEKAKPAAGATPYRAAKANIRVERRPAGRYMTVINGLQTYGTEKLKKIAEEIKKIQSGVVTLKRGIIEIQGDKLTEIKAWFAKSKK